MWKYEGRRIFKLVLLIPQAFELPPSPKGSSIAVPSAGAAGAPQGSLAESGEAKIK